MTLNEVQILMEEFNRHISDRPGSFSARRSIRVSGKDERHDHQLVAGRNARYRIAHRAPLPARARAPLPARARDTEIAGKWNCYQSRALPTSTPMSS